MSKGISPLIAGVLLIAFTLAVAAIFSGWITGIMKTTTTKVGAGASSQIECSKGNLQIDRVYNSTSGKTYVILHNIGTVDLTGNFSILCGNNVNTNTSNVALKPGEAEMIEFGIDCTGTSSVKVTSMKCPTVSDTCESGEDCWGLS